MNLENKLWRQIKLVITAFVIRCAIIMSIKCE